MLSESTNGKNTLYPRLKVSGEESTDEGSNSSDNESAVLPVAKTKESFSRSALRARGEAALARLQAQSQSEEMVASPLPTDRTQWTVSSECTQWSPENIRGEQNWSQDAWVVNCMMGMEQMCPWERQPWGTVDPWGNSVSAEAENFAALSQPTDAGITQSYKDDPIFELLERSSSGHPVKVLIDEMAPASPPNQFQAGVPVKKRPPFPECGVRCKGLDPNVPAKKRMPTFLLEAMSGY